MSKLVAKPVRRYRHPPYPTKLQALADVDLLRGSVPAAWLTRSELSGALGLLLVGNLAGCSEPAAGRASAGASTQPVTSQPALVAPLFLHGDGTGASQHPNRGMLGCIAVAAPVYLSEEDALQIIREELDKAGLGMKDRNVPLSSIIIEGHELRVGHDWVHGAHAYKLVSRKGPLEIDLLDREHHVAVEYISDEDFYPLGGNDDNEFYERDLKQAGETLRAAIRGHEKENRFGIFYDPITHHTFGERWAEPGSEHNWQTSEKAAIAESRRLLRLQVLDFVNWLKAQGAI